jgi:nitronate monooxygenase
MAPPDEMAPPSIETPLTSLLGVRHPILLAPMGDTAGGRLAAAVSDAGALGLIGGGYADVAWLERELLAADGARVGVGFVTFALAERPAALALALQADPVAVQLSFGDPAPFADAVHAAGAALICQVQTRAEVAAAVAAGADVIVAQGRDAGGHGRPDRSTMALIPSVVDQVGSIPVVAAGGIADGRGLAAALALGAAGATLGTRFLASREAISSPEEARLLVERGADDTVRTAAFDVVRGPSWPDGHDGRVLRNQLTTAFDDPDDPADEDGLRRRLADAAADDFSVHPVWAGEGLDLVTAVPPAAAIVESVVAEAVDRIGSVSGQLRRGGPSVLADRIHGK